MPPCGSREAFPSSSPRRTEFQVFGVRLNTRSIRLYLLGARSDLPLSTSLPPDQFADHHVEGCLRVAVILPRLALGKQVRGGHIVKRCALSPARTWLHESGIEADAFLSGKFRARDGGCSCSLIGRKEWFCARWVPATPRRPLTCSMRGEAFIHPRHKCTVVKKMVPRALSFNTCRPHHSQLPNSKR